MQREKNTSQVVFRIPSGLRKHYEELATRQRRKLSDVLRLALEDQAKKQQNENQPVAA